MNPKQRDRGRILTPDGLSRLQQAIRAWELEHEVRCTQERIKELTSAVKEGGLDPGTTRKILKAKEGVDPESIRCLFTTFGLQLNETDLAASSRLQVQADPNFVGREGAIADLNTLVNRGAKVIVIQARGGVGKTTLARKYLQQEFGSFLEFPIAKEIKDIASIESLIEEKLRQLGEEPGREFFVSLDRLKRKLQDERIGILIDNLEPALDSAGKFIEPHRRYVELLRVLTDPVVQSVTLITSRERLRESSVTVEHYMLRSLDIEAWEQFFQSRNLATDTSAFAALHNAYGGNAKAMDIIRGAILEDYAGDVAAYWQANQHDLFIERDLEDLVTQQFDRLQRIDSDAYNLLCRMGCYRYQDVPTVPIEGLLCLLWDVPENRRRRVVKSLQDRSLVEIAEGEFWLHPVIRGEAIGRLRGSEDWETANRRAAEFWTISVDSIQTGEDAKQALESYYHYIAISNFIQSANVLIQPRKVRWSEWKKGEPLGRSLYKVGVLRETISAIISVIDKLEPGYALCRLNNILGDLYWLVGNIHEAVKCHEQSRKIASEFLDSPGASNSSSPKFIDENDSDGGSFEGTRVASYYNEGICQIDLWEIEKAAELFETAILYADAVGSYKFSARASYCLAFIFAYLGMREKSFALIEAQSPALLRPRWGVWSRGYSLLFLGAAYRYIGDFDKSLENYLQAIEFVGESYYLTLKCRIINGLAEIYRLKSKYEKAFECHSEAIEISSRIGAKYNLAEAKYQLGLSYKSIGNLDQSDDSFQESIQLFTKMEAPKQVERVRRSMKAGTEQR